MAASNDPGASIRNWLVEVGATKLLTLAEPEIAMLRGARIGQARHIAAKLAAAQDDSFVTFPKKYGRNTTLGGIYFFLRKDHEKEYLVTAYGRRKGGSFARPAQFDGVHLSHGAQHSVGFSDLNLSYLEKHAGSVRDAEVMVCHNHPRNLVSDLLARLIDWSPLPSNIDRETMCHFKYKSLVRWLAAGRLLSIKFYVMENRRIREIKLPSANRIVSLLKSFLEFAE
jgi:hypothetical protein